MWKAHVHVLDEIDDSAAQRARPHRTVSAIRWWRTVPFEVKLPSAIVVVMALMGLMYSAAVYRAVKRSATEDMLTRLHNLGMEVAGIATTNNRQLAERMSHQLESMSIDELVTTLAAADSTPTALVDAKGRVLRIAGRKTNDVSQKALGDAVKRAQESTRDASFVGPMFRNDTAIQYWGISEVRKDTSQRYIGRLSTLKSNANASRALQSLIGETNVYIANRDVYAGPWIRLEGEPVNVPTPRADTTTYVRSDSIFVYRKNPIPGTSWVVVTEGYPAAIRLRAFQFAERTLLSTLWLLVLGGVIAWMLARWITQPLRELASAAQEIGAGHYHARVSIEESGALGQLGTAFNLMASEVERGRRELDARVRERTAELQVVNDELQSFSYSVSHDLRSPLRSIDGFSQALLEDYGPKLDATAQDYLRRLRAGAQRMGILIDDLLLLSRVARQTTEPAEVDVSKIAWEIVDELRHEHRDRKIDISIQDGIRVMADPGLLRIVLQNLIGNGWKFSARNPSARIEVSMKHDAGNCVITVSDNGAGFDMSHAQHLFGAFQRLHTSREFSGTGIGLATVRRAVNRLGGTVWASAAVGEGARFSFTIKDGYNGEFSDSAR